MNLPRDLEIKLDRAAKLAARAKTEADREAARSARKAALDELAKREADHWTTRALAEQNALEQLRGGSVVVEEIVQTVQVLKDGNPVWKRGRLVMKQERVKRPRLTNRDGLETLLQSQTITPGQYAHGIKYRGLWEAYDHTGGLTPPQIGQGRGGGKRPLIHPVTGAYDLSEVVKACKPARDAAELLTMERAVLASTSPDALRTLRAVAGDGRTIYSLTGRGGRRRAIKLTQGLIAALDVVGHTGKDQKNTV